MIRRGDRVTVTDPADEYFGQAGHVAGGEHHGLVSGRPMVTVQLDGREGWDVEGFYVEQLTVDTAVAA